MRRLVLVATVLLLAGCNSRSSWEEQQAQLANEANPPSAPETDMIAAAPAANDVTAVGANDVNSAADANEANSAAPANEAAPQG